MRFFICLAITLAACDASAPAEPCKDIPDGGCPLSHGVACEDPTCAAVYACFGGAWTLDHTCPPHEAGGVDASHEASAHDSSIDAPPGAYGGPGCGDLQPPDCSLGFALACPSGCCDCVDLYVCQNGGWNLWGACTDDGGISQR